MSNRKPEQYAKFAGKWKVGVKLRDDARTLICPPFDASRDPQRRTVPKQPCGADMIGTTPKLASPRYSGNAVLGIATLHKSNAQPVFSVDEAIEVARMRR